MITGFELLKEVKELDDNIYVSMEFCNKEISKRDREIERLNNIIKEVREYIEHENFKRNILVGVSTKKYTRDILNNILEILDKVD